MGLIQFVIDNPVKVAVGVILLVMFGLLSLFNVPIQLTPDVDVPVVTVTTMWTGASPQEIESEIVDRQEDKLKSIAGLKKMTSTSTEGMATVRLEFPVGVDKEAALREVSDKLRQVPEYPEEVDEPTVSATDDDMENIIAWMILRGDETVDVPAVKTFIEDNVKPILERAEGISEVNVYGGYDREIQVEVDAAVLAARGLTLRDVERALRRQNENISAGTLMQGKRDFTYRTVGQYTSLGEIENTVIAYRAGGPVFVRDVATVIDGFKKQRGFVRSEGQFVIALPARRETGANVLTAMQNLRRQVEVVNREILDAKRMNLKLTQVYDETTYITSAIDLVKSNILFGGLLAIVVLLLFLRSASATGVVAVSIPISVIGTFLVITLLGRSLNVVMLAGMAFAVGMVVDNAIVVLENIYRHRTMGKGRFEAALDGAREVWGAVLASTLTTMAVFVPVISIQEEAGQLFKDIAIAIAAAVGLSLVVSILVIPPLAARTLGGADTAAKGDKPWFLGTWIASLVTAINRGTASRVSVVLGMSLVAVVGSWLLAPSADYLPAGNKNLIFGVLITPPGYGVETYKKMGYIVEDGDPADPLDGLRPFWEAVDDPELAAQLPPVQFHLGEDGSDVRTVQPPPIENFFFVAYGGTVFMGCTSAEPTVVTPLVPAMTRAAQRIPGIFPVFFQHGLFQGGGAGVSSVDLEIRSENLDDVVRAAGALFGGVMGAGYNRPQPSPSNFDLGRPEVQLNPNRTKAADVGLDVADVGFITQACVDGAYIGEYNDRGDKIDMALKFAGLDEATPYEVGYVPIYTPSGHVIPLASVIDFSETSAPQQINHIEQMPSVTLAVQSKQGQPLQATMDDLENKIIAPLREAGAISPNVYITLAGSASKLTDTQRALVGDFRGTVTSPRFFGMPVYVSIGCVLALVATAAAVVGTLLGPRTALRLTLVALGMLAFVFLAMNMDFTLMLFQSRAVLAMLITYLLMAALFESFAYPFVIMFSVPLAAVGGFAALRIVHYFSANDITSPVQQLDVLTMLGFVILIGVVVNNAILIVHQALNVMREEGADADAAVAKSVATRTRPIFMSAMTSVFGMLPLVLMTGAGSELYRGIGSVVVGGLVVSTVFTLVVVPAMFSLFIDARAWLTSQPRAEAGQVAVEPAVAQTGNA